MRNLHSKIRGGVATRFMMDGETGNMIHSTVPPRQVNTATGHKTVTEFWYVLEGHGEIWRDDGEESCVTELFPGVSIDIPPGTAFQYRNVSEVGLEVHLHRHAALAGGQRGQLL